MCMLVAPVVSELCDLGLAAVRLLCPVGILNRLFKCVTIHYSRLVKELLKITSFKALRIS